MTFATVSDRDTSVATNCLICDTRQAGLGDRPEPVLRLHRCPACGFGWFVGEPAAADASATQYLRDETSPTHYYRSTVAVDLETFRARLMHLEAIGSRPGRILDVGCSIGTFLTAASARGWRPVGLEPNPAAAAIARAAGFEVLNGFFDSSTSESLSGFDVVHLGDVLEHVRNPLAMLARARAVARPGGTILVVTPDIDSLMGRLLQIKPKEHLVYFTVRSLSLALQRAGFADVRVARSSRRRSMTAMVHSTTFSSRARPFLRLAALPGVRGPLERTLVRLFKDELLATATAP